MNLLVYEIFVVRMSSKCPQMSNVKVLVQKGFKLGGFCAWPSIAVYRDYKAWWLVLGKK